MSRTHRLAALGFLFGTIGVYLLAGVSLVSPLFEVVSAPLLSPGRLAADRLIGPEGTDGDVALLTLLNGLFYMLVFVAGGWIVRTIRGERRQ
jgi:hypothetical protein